MSFIPLFRNQVKALLEVPCKEANEKNREIQIAFGEWNDRFLSASQCERNVSVNDW